MPADPQRGHFGSVLKSDFAEGPSEADSFRLDYQDAIYHLDVYGRVNKTQFAVLGMLELGMSTGYEMKGFVERSLGHFWSESYGALYPILKRLGEEELIAGRGDAREAAGARTRKAFESTAAGREALRQWLKEPVADSPERNELLLKLFFGARISRAECLTHIEREEAEAARIRATYDGIEASLDSEMAGHPELPFWKITLSYGRRMCDATLAWAAETRETLEAQPEHGAREGGRNA